jgi:hypothetical protein
MNTTTNTGAASLSDEQIEAIKHLIARGSTFPDHNGSKGPVTRVDYARLQVAAPILSRLLTPTPQADAAPIEAELAKNVFSSFNACMFRDQCRAAIAAGGAQEPFGWVKPAGGNYFTRNESSAKRIGGMIPVYAAPLPREAATVALTDEQSYALRLGANVLRAAGRILQAEKIDALLAAAANGEQ